MNAIELSHICKDFGSFAIQDLTLAVPSGTICGLVGENGAGKSTTIRLLCGALRPDSGTASALGVDVSSPEFLAAKEDIGVVLDEATAGLDPIVRDEILDIFNDFTREEDHSILISSHILSDLEKLCDYIAFLHQGRLLFCEEKDRLLEEYGIFSDTAAQLECLLPEAIVAREPNGYGGVRALVKRELAPVGWQLERASVEDIILFLVKGAKNA